MVLPDASASGQPTSRGRSDAHSRRSPLHTAGEPMEGVASCAFEVVSRLMWELTAEEGDELGDIEYQRSEGEESEEEQEYQKPAAAPVAPTAPACDARVRGQIFEALVRGASTGSLADALKAMRLRALQEKGDSGSDVSTAMSRGGELQRLDDAASDSDASKTALERAPSPQHLADDRLKCQAFDTFAGAAFSGRLQEALRSVRPMPKLEAESAKAAPVQPKTELPVDELKSRVFGALLSGSQSGSLVTALHAARPHARKEVVAAEAAAAPRQPELTAEGGADGSDTEDEEDADVIFKCDVVKALVEGARSGLLAEALEAARPSLKKEAAVGEAVPASLKEQVGKSVAPSNVDDEDMEVVSVVSDNDMDEEDIEMEALAYVHMAMRAARRAVQLGLLHEARLGEAEQDLDQAMPTLAPAMLPEEEAETEQPPAFATASAPTEAAAEAPLAQAPAAKFQRPRARGAGARPVVQVLVIEPPALASDALPAEAEHSALAASRGERSWSKPAGTPAARRVPTPLLDLALSPKTSPSRTRRRVIGGVVREAQGFDTSLVAQFPVATPAAAAAPMMDSNLKSKSKKDAKVRSSSPAGPLHPKSRPALVAFRMDSDGEVEDAPRSSLTRQSSITNMYNLLGANFHSLETKGRAEAFALPHARALGPLIVPSSPKSSAQTRSSSTSALSLDLGGPLARGAGHAPPSRFAPVQLQMPRAASSSSLSFEKSRPGPGLLPSLSGTKPSKLADWSAERTHKAARMWGSTTLAPVF